MNVSYLSCFIQKFVLMLKKYGICMVFVKKALSTSKRLVSIKSWVHLKFLPINFLLSFLVQKIFQYYIYNYVLSIFYKIDRHNNNNNNNKSIAFMKFSFNFRVTFYPILLVAEYTKGARRNWKWNCHMKSSALMQQYWLYTIEEFGGKPAPLFG